MNLVDIREQYIAFLVIDRYPVAGEHKMASGEVAQAAHDSESFFEVSFVNVHRCAPASIARNRREASDALAGANHPSGRRVSRLGELRFPSELHGGFFERLRDGLCQGSHQREISRQGTAVLRDAARIRAAASRMVCQCQSL